MKVKFIFLLLIPSVLINSQNNYMSLSFGGIVPFGDFASTTDLDNHGFSLNGFSGDYSGAYFLKKHFGIAANIKYASNSTNESIANRLLCSEIPEDFLPDTNRLINVGLWNQVSITAGPEITFAANRMNIDIFALGGFNFIMPPDMSVQIESEDESYSRKLDTKNVSYCFESGIALRYHLNERTSVRIHCSYLQSVVNGDNTTTITIDQDISTTNDKYSCKIQTMNAGIGIVYRL